jgi:hypothetical protein
MAPYMYKRNNEGIHIINVAKSWEKLMVAARMIAAIPNPRDILVRISHFSCSRKLTKAFFCSPERDGRGQPLYRLSQTEISLREPCLSSPPTPRPTTWVENGLPVP